MNYSQILEIASCTDPGMVRSHNEDSIASAISLQRNRFGRSTGDAKRCVNDGTRTALRRSESRTQ
jgi:hypothetical protein